MQNSTAPSSSSSESLGSSRSLSTGVQDSASLFLCSSHFLITNECRVLPIHFVPVQSALLNHTGIMKQPFLHPHFCKFLLGNSVLSAWNRFKGRKRFRVRAHISVYLKPLTMTLAAATGSLLRQRAIDVGVSRATFGCYCSYRNTAAVGRNRTCTLAFGPANQGGRSSTSRALVCDG